MYIDIDRTGQVAQSTKRWDLSQLTVVENLCQLWKLSHKISQELRKLPVTSCLEGQVFPSRPDPTWPLPLPPFLAWFEKRYDICPNCVNFLAQKFGRLKVWQKSFPYTTSSSFLLLARALKDTKTGHQMSRQGLAQNEQNCNFWAKLCRFSAKNPNFYWRKQMFWYPHNGKTT